ncbi:flagellar hook-associated protein FlgL [Bacillus sp. BRMEA1]|uniref:flagellar hook-associated protein FlgL n=1 Tax=Neobacillus endophyticus TaxID=2738405 RepID=UPI001563F2E7|nr:flagellar hook-associated protein FlgL [Neobacillus endophyticus]NRD79398.1 flagellar hook-associated protein FlgL [Neobacillus endophyticus]
MSTRITQTMMNQTLLANLQTNYRNLSQTQQELSSGKKINKPSDDPVAAVRAMNYQSTLNEIDQYKRNVSDGSSWMQSTDSSLDEVTQVLQRVRELTVQAGNSTNSSTDLQAIKDEITQLSGHLVEVGNSEIGGRYLFGGTATTTAPCDGSQNPPAVSNNNGAVNYQVGKGSTVQINVTGNQVFNQNGGMFNVLKSITDSIDNGTNPSDQLNNLDAQINNVITIRSDLGARMNRMDLSSSRLDGLEQSTNNLMSNEVDVDIAQAYTNFSAQQAVYNSALSAGAKIIQPSLVDFLK